MSNVSPSEINIQFTGRALAINGHVWTSSPLIEEVCSAIGADNLVDGPPLLYDGKPGARFRYFEDLGICLLEIIPTSRIKRITVYMETPPAKRARPSSYPKTDAAMRPTKKPFPGVLELNGKQLRSPLRFTQFPLNGELRFIRRIAIGEKTSAHVSVRLRFVESVSGSFKEGADF